MAIEVNNDYETLRTLEIDLRAELEAVDLVGELDLDYWGPIAESLLRPAADTHQISTIRRRWPATFVVYLVYQGLTNGEHRFWEFVSIPQFQFGSDVGPEFLDVLEQLNLDTFKHLEDLEGLKKDSSGRYLRRIYLHGGIPLRAVKNVVRLLVATLNSGVTSSAELLAEWASLDLRVELNSRPAARCFLYTGPHAVKLVDQLFELVRLWHRNQSWATSTAPTHLKAGLEDYLANPPSTAWNFKPGPAVRIDPDQGEPFLQIPADINVEWYINDEYVGDSSRQVSNRFSLPFAVNGIWAVTSEDYEGNQTTRRFVSETLKEVILLFDENGRLHPRGSTLSGRRAYILAGAAMEVEDDIERRSLNGDWEGFDLITLDLREYDSGIDITLGSGETVHVPVINEWETVFDSGFVKGLRCDGLYVLTGRVALGFDGYTPNPDTITIETAHRTLLLSECRTVWGSYDITACFDRASVQETELLIYHHDELAEQRSFFYVPNLKFERPELVAPGSAVDISLEFRDGAKTHRAAIAVAAQNDSGFVTLDLEHGRRDFEIKLNRLSWSLTGRHDQITFHDQDVFWVRLPELSDQLLSLVTEGHRVRIELFDAGVEHIERARRHRFYERLSKFELRTFSETARQSSAARCRVMVRTQNDDLINVGIIENRYEPFNVQAVQIELRDGAPALEVSWEEHVTWENREVRIWDATTAELVIRQPVDDGDTRVQVPIEAHSRRLRYLIDVDVNDEWDAPKPPTLGDGCIDVFLGTALEQQIAEAAFKNRRIQGVDNEMDEEVDQASPMLAALLIDRVSKRTSFEEMRVLRDLITDNRFRVIEVITELFDQLYESDDETTIGLVEQYLWGLLPGLWLYPVNDYFSRVTNWQLENLWEIAPMAAACVDQVHNSVGDQEEESMYRWEHATGFNHRRPADLAKALDDLTNWPVQEFSRWEPTTLLGVDAWHTAIEDVLEAEVQRANWQYLHPHMEFLSTIENRTFGQRSRVLWAGIVRRVDQKLNYLGPNAKWLSRLVMLSCELLQPANYQDEAAVLAALETIHRVYPQATRTAFVYSATALRIRESVGPAGDLVQ